MLTSLEVIRARSAAVFNGSAGDVTLDPGCNDSSNWKIPISTSSLAATRCSRVFVSEPGPWLNPFSGRLSRKETLVDPRDEVRTIKKN